jgi:ElaB/YqjD/DUF883 family membrane-anchored ribosome-binding protein
MATATTSANPTMSDAARDIADDVSKGAEKVTERAGATAEKTKEHAQRAQSEIVRGAEEIAAQVNDTLRAVGVDTDRMVDAAKKQAGDLESMIIDEIRARPLRAVGLAAAVGLFVGFLTAR